MKINGKVIIEKFNTVTEETTSITEYNDICYTAGEVQNMGEVKVATGSGWLIFNEADEGKSIEGSFTAHYLY